MEKRGILKKKLNLERILVWGAAAAVLLSLSYLAVSYTHLAAAALPAAHPPSIFDIAALPYAAGR